MSQIQTASIKAGESQAPKQYSATSWQMHKWGMGGVADYWMYSQFASIMLVFTTTYKLDPRYVGLALVIPRLFDGLVDPFFGHLSDNTHTRWGRRRPFLFATTLIGAILVMSLWWTPIQWSQWAQFIWLTTAATLLFTNWGIYTMAHFAFGYELSDDYNDRSRVLAIRNAYNQIMTLPAGYLWSAAIVLGTGLTWTVPHLGWTIRIPSVGSEINGFRILSVGVALLILIFGMVPVFFCKERFVNVNRQSVKLWESCKAAMSCRPFLILLLLQLARTLGFSLYNSLAGIIGIYYVCRGDKLLFTNAQIGLGGVFGASFSLLLWPLAKPLTRQIGKRWGLITTFGFSFIFSVMLPFITLPGKIYLLVFVGFAFIFPAAIQNLFLQSTMPDICDIDELNHGERREGLFAAVKSLADKYEISFCILIGMWLLWYVGYDAQLHQQPPEVLHKLLWCAFTPQILFSFIALVIAFNFPVTEKMMMDVRTKLEKRRAAATPPPAPVL
ncbi:MAG: MFS transporter [Verrucomicrobiota bacterium]